MGSVLKDFEVEIDTESSLDQVYYVRAAARLLEQLFTGLQALAINNPDFARVMSTDTPDVRLRLGVLQDTIRLLSTTKEASSATQLTRRATARISWLSEKIDEMMLYALGDQCPDDSPPVSVH